MLLQGMRLPADVVMQLVPLHIFSLLRRTKSRVSVHQLVVVSQVYLEYLKRSSHQVS